MRHLSKFWLLLLCVITSSVNAQLIPVNIECPPNIGFESGDLSYWNCFAGTILRDGSLNLASTTPITDRHTIIQNTYPQALDPWGKFPINCPNGSGFSVRLGNSQAGGQAESISYTFNIPPDQNDYSILYNYAVVFQNPPHQPWEQPRFTSKVYNVTDNKYIDCGSFQFVASSNLPGFQLAAGSGNVYFKPWAPVTVNLTGLAGKTVRLEFTTNDCAFTQHFGYAYLDVNQDCSSSPISGSTYCAGAQSVILTAPFGFASYSWYTADFSTALGNDNILNISPAPPADTKYAVIITPYEGIGCLDTLFTTIRVSNEPFKLKVQPEITGCSSGVDITAASITAGSTPGLTYSYFTDLTQTNYLAVPSRVTVSGIYYIKGINKSGCNDIQPIKVNIGEPPTLSVTDPPGVCKPVTVDITDPAITSGSELGLTLTYWNNSTATVPLANPAKIDTPGTYYIMAKKNDGCGIVKPVDVKIGETPTVVIDNPTGCGKINIAAAGITAGSSPGIAYSYWQDAAATVPLTDLNNITSSGIYYIMAAATSGCSIIRPIDVTVNPLPVFTVTDPAPVVYPVQTVDITSAVSPINGVTYTYWLDSLTKKPVSNPRAINKRGRYFIRATNQYGCSAIKGVNAFIIPPPEPIVYIPNAFTPNGDGLNDLFTVKLIGETSITQLRVYNRWGQLVYDDPDLSHQWNGKLKGIDLPAGVYVWTISGMDTYNKKPFARKGMITLIK